MTKQSDEQNKITNLKDPDQFYLFCKGKRLYISISCSFSSIINFIIFPYSSPMSMQAEYSHNFASKSNSYNHSNLFQSFGSPYECKSEQRTTDFSHSEAYYKASQLLKYVSPFSPYTQFTKSTSSQSQKDDFMSITDRYIPSRKLLKKQSLYQEEMIEENTQNDIPKSESSAVQVADIYRKCFLTEGEKSSKQVLGMIETYQNSNIFKYSAKSSSMKEMDLPTMNKSPSFEFAEDLISTSPVSKKRKISKLPCKVLDAPALQDDYYLNLIDWSSQNYLAVGLASSVYLWNAGNSKVTKLCDLGTSDSATSVAWSLKGPMFALGTNSGEVQIWDVNKMKRVRILPGHTNRVGAIAWNSSILSTGSRDKTILHRDLRQNNPFMSKLIGHKQEICGLKWSPDDQQLCSGGNDNKLLVWNPYSTEPILKFNDHTAAVKAMAWSPHQHGLLASGGGTADRTIRFRNTLNGTTVKTMDVGSQVCNLIFSKSLNELVSTHGYSQNEINVWKYPKMQKIATLTGHTYRVLYLAMSPDGSTIVTGAGDETLRFWNIFPNKNETSKKMSSLLNVDNVMIR